MLVTITSKRTITLPAELLEALGLKPGDRLELRPCADGLVFRPKRIDASRLAPLRGKLSANPMTFDIHVFRGRRGALAAGS
jgi:AbrB family looped-hinge helix DNA binding protein